jgi:hypothetical protein
MAGHDVVQLVVAVVVPPIWRCKAMVGHQGHYLPPTQQHTKKTLLHCNSGRAKSHSSSLPFNFSQIRGQQPMMASPIPRGLEEAATAIMTENKANVVQCVTILLLLHARSPLIREGITNFSLCSHH